ncbi:MAG: NAD(P)-binding protein [Actinomycetota bacterium]
MSSIDTERLRVAIEQDADLRVLLMCLVHLTGDTRWIEPPFTPRRDVRLVSDPAAGLPDEVQAEIRAAILDLLADGVPEPAITDPGDELMVRMMRTCLGERVGEEYSLMMREDLGFVSRAVEWPAPPDPDRLAEHDVLIVGAGVSGLALGATLRDLGIDYRIVEQSDQVGGTWYDNRYPGCGVDTPNHAYSFSHGERNDWTRYFSPRDEIQAYLERCADDFGVRSHISFGTTVVGATWDEVAERWRVRLRTADGEHTTDAKVLVSAVGVLNVPKLPAIDGVDDFAGPSFHTARWPDDADLAGTHVAVVGTGATSMQLVPSIADDVASLTIYQRSPQWARPTPGYGEAIPEGGRWLLRHVPFYAEWFRFTMFWRYGDGLLPHLRRDPEWPHPERAMNRTNDRHRQEMTDHLLAELDGRPDLVERCLPDYPPFGKRILLDNGWYRTIRRDHVELVTDPIDRIVEDGVTTVDGRHRPADVVVFATGFQTTQLTARLGVTGRGGRDLADAWADDDPRAHLGITVPGFPNLFLMLGPNTGLGHGGSTIFMSECQARYITGCIVSMVSDGTGPLEVRRDVHDEYVDRVDAEHAELIWTHPGMTNWYRNPAGRITALLPWRLVDYWAMTHDPDPADFIAERAPSRPGSH